MKDDIYYAVLMEQHKIGDRMYFLKSKKLIKGKICSYQNYNYFQDIDEKEYCFAASGTSFNDIDFVAHFVIGKQHLKEKYSEFPLEIAKEKYFEEYRDKCYFSFEIDGHVHIVPEKNPFPKEESDHPLFLIDTITSGEELNNIYRLILQKVTNASNYDELKEILQKFESLLLKLNDKIGDNLARDCVNALVDIYADFLIEVDQIYQESGLKVVKYLSHSKLKSTERMMKTLAKDYDEISNHNSLLEIGKYNAYGTLDVASMKKYLDERIIGQEQAKIDVISALTSNQLMDNPKHKKSCLLVGPTGSGKTALATAISEYLDVPMKVYNTTGLTSSGYVGKSIDDIMVSLLATADGDLEKAQKGIVVLDEIDKKASKKANDPAYSGVLNELLPFVEGTTYNITYKNKDYTFDTSRLNILATGSFASLIEGNHSSDYQMTKIGFRKTEEDHQDYDIEYPELTEEVLHDAGIPMELLGRMPVITQLSGHTKETLKRILTDGKDSPLFAEKRALEKIKIYLSYTEGYLDKVAEEALTKKTGARSLTAMIEKSIKMAKYTAQEYLGKYPQIVLTEEAVHDNLECILIDQDGNPHSTREVREEEKEQTASTKKYVKSTTLYQ